MPSPDDLTLAVDLGGTTMRAALVEPSGRILQRHARPTPHDTAAPAALLALITEVLGDRRPPAVIGVPGRIDYLAGRLEWAPNLPTGWVEHLSRSHLSHELGLEVSLANDADLAAVGEAYFGAGREHADLVYMTVSTGIGAGVLLARRLVRGRRSLAEIGHTVIDRRALDQGLPATVEDLASGTAIAREASAAGLVGGASRVVELVRAGDPGALALWAGAVQAAAVAVVNLVQLFAPELIIIGGGVASAGDLLLKPIRDFVATHGLKDMPSPIEIRPASLADDAGLVGAAAWQRALGSPDR